MPHMKCLSTLILLNVVKTRTEITSMTSHRRSVTINFHYTEKHPLSKFRLKKIKSVRAIYMFIYWKCNPCRRNGLFLL